MYATNPVDVDNGTADAVNYQYDSLGRLIHSSASKDGVRTILTEHLYDRANRIDKQTYQLRNSDDTFTTYAFDYSYRASDGALISVDNVNGNFGGYELEYDEIARLSTRKNCYFRQDYTYRNIDSSRTTTQIEKIAYSKRDGGTNFNPFSLAYTYDDLGNIETITGTDISGQNAAYEYDIQGQLTKATTNGVTRKYIYDTYGNIREIRDASDNTLHSYSYGNADWKDLLTKYDTGEILYEGQTSVDDTPLSGNPISYYNGTRWNFGWAKGRQLVKAESDNHEIEYTYDMAGIRDSKTVDDVTYNYLTLDGKVVRQTWEKVIPGTDQKKEYVFDIIYDANGLPYACEYEGYQYYYVLNQQGDVIQIIGSGGTVCAEYSYDAWGNILRISGLYAGTLGEVNPIRYRGYYYDTETGFYYLQSRYYDPSIGRWISTDGTIPYESHNLLGYNAFAYCFNNPVNLSDTTGYWPEWIETAAKVASVVVAVVAVAAVATTVGGVVATATAGAVAAGKLTAATIFLGAALSGINGGVANEANGNSYLNGYIGGATGGTIQGVMSKNPLGTTLGGGLGVATGTAVTDMLNNLDPDSKNSSYSEIRNNAFASGLRGLATASVTAFVGYASDFAVYDGCGGLMPQYTRGFGEAIKAFFGWLDDAVVYTWG